MCILPIENKPEANEENKKVLIKLAKQIDKIMQDKEYQNIVLSKYLIEKQEFKNELYSKNINILDGRWLFKHLIPEVITYVSEVQEIEIGTKEISILVNENNNLNLRMIIDLAKIVKTLNIVTNNIGSFKTIEEYLYENFGIMIKITNNNRKALIKSNIIINLDFPKELLNKYVIPRKTIVLNMEEEIKIQSKRFSGINAHYYNVEFPDKYKNELIENNIYGYFENTLLYESILYRKNSYEKIREEIVENKSKIVSLIGKRGTISKDEFKAVKTNN